MRGGSLGCCRCRRFSRADAVATHEADAERYAAAWHAARRKAITLAHPEVARLAERRLCGRRRALLRLHFLPLQFTQLCVHVSTVV